MSFVDRISKNASVSSHPSNISTDLLAKRTITFDPYSKTNAILINRLCEIEYEIIERYIATYCPTKIASYILKTQLISGAIKYHSITFDAHTEFESSPSHSIYETERSSENGTIPERERNALRISESVGIGRFSGSRRETHEFRSENRSENEKCILKISGVWETTTNVGITMKFILLGRSPERHKRS